MALGNRHEINGRLGRDPDIRYMTSGTPVANLSVATDRFYRDSENELKKVTDWHRVVMFGKLAERAAKFLKKGKEILLEGYCRTRDWEDQDGIKRYATETVCEQFRMVGAAPNGAAAPPPEAYDDDPAAYGYGNAGDPTAQAAAGSGPMDGDGDIPF